MIEARPNEIRCKFEAYVNCDGRTNCERCGWNPAEKAKRVAQLKKQEEMGLPLKLKVKRARIACAMGYALTCDNCNRRCHKWVEA